MERRSSGIFDIQARRWGIRRSLEIEQIGYEGGKLLGFGNLEKKENGNTSYRHGQLEDSTHLNDEYLVKAKEERERTIKPIM